VIDQICVSEHKKKKIYATSPNTSPSYFNILIGQSG